MLESHHRDSYKIIQSVIALMLNGQQVPIEVFKDLMIYFTSGIADDVEIAGFLKIFADFPIKSDYLIAAIEVLREQMIAVNLSDDIEAIDCCGTGGDGLKSLNISTATAFFLADYGVKVAKHGNRSVTSQSGSADILEAIGYPIKQEPDAIVKQIQETGLTFMFAPYFHPVLKHVAAARKSLEKRTIFNLLGPLLNPARVKRQLIGIYDFSLAEEIAKTLIHFGCHRAMIVTSSEGADELTLSGDNEVCYIENGHYHFGTINTQEVGLKNQPITAIQGEDSAYNAEAMKKLFNREPSAYYDTVLFNAAAGLWVADKVQTISEGVEIMKQQTKKIDYTKYLV